MHLIPDRILTINLICSTFIFYIAAKIYILSKINELKPQIILIPILILHSFRHFGLMFLAKGATYPGMPPQFAYPAAIGDLLAAILAFLAIFATVNNLRVGRLLLWVFSIEGTIDLIVAITLATVYGAPDYMGAAYWIPAFWVPALLVSHYIVFIVLIRQSSTTFN
ncbi:MAG: hypothetical protein ND866_03040 [Pyrinomonadaceae bacterium]|nr:hypothetical protein [Pyrinomonadaceae bacterium]